MPTPANAIYNSIDTLAKCREKRREKRGKALNDSRAQSTDETYESIPDQELVMGKDAFEQLKMAIMKDSEPQPHCTQRNVSP